jgi:hypothetical protein
MESTVLQIKNNIVPQVKIRESHWPKHITCYNVTWMDVAKKMAADFVDLEVQCLFYTCLSELFMI